MRKSILVVLIVLLSGCASRSTSPASGPVVFVDAVGNRMVVDTSPRRKTVEVNSTASIPEPDTRQVEPSPGSVAKFGGESYIESSEIERDLESREKNRLLIVPDGAGGRQLLHTTPGEGNSLLPDVGTMKPAWQSCRVVVPLLRMNAGRAFSLAFPARDIDKLYGGYLLPVGKATRKIRINAFVRKGVRASPLLAQVDDAGRVVAIVNNMPTQSIPETRFRYGSVGGSVELEASATASGNLAVLDGALLRERFPTSCGPITSEHDAVSGEVSVEIISTGE